MCVRVSPTNMLTYVLYFKIRHGSCLSQCCGRPVDFALSLAMGGQRAGRRGVLGCDRAEEPMNIQTYQKSIKEEWFSCTTAFVALAVLSPVVFPTSFADSLSARAILLCNYFGLVESHKKCQCSRTVSLVCRKWSVLPQQCVCLRRLCCVLMPLLVQRN
jgi:hypothetical protein